MSGSIAFTPEDFRYIEEHATRDVLEIVDAVIDALQTPQGQQGQQVKLNRVERILDTADLLERGVFARLIPLNEPYANQRARQYTRDLGAEGIAE